MSPRLHPSGRAAVKASQKRQLRLIYDCAVRLIDFVSSMMEFSALRQRAKKAEGDAGEGPTMNKDPVAIVSSNPPQSRFKSRILEYLIAEVDSEFIDPMKARGKV